MRIEDIDTQRCTDQLVADCLEDLAWLGLTWEEPVLRQSHRIGVYRAEAVKLEAMGLTYPCFCTRRDIARTAVGLDPDGAPRYPGSCKALAHHERKARIAAGEPFALRLDLAASVPEFGPFSWRDEGANIKADVSWSDVVILRKDIGVSYHLAVVIDDAMQGITHVVRGMDLFAQTAIHRCLQKLLKLPEPVYHHHRLVLDEDGQKLAKSAFATPLRQMRVNGVSAHSIKTSLGFS